MYIRSKLVGFGHYLPNKILTNDDLSHMVETNDEWIRTRTGICLRHIASEDETTSVLAGYAIEKAIKNAGLLKAAYKVKTENYSAAASSAGAAAASASAAAFASASA